ncbi:hypothetical protein G6F25_010093 [Rhizopus arrhizus]|nr:hypothetical protein G6F20_009896 [Rhizopus arrhizus]KAG1033914.1 hypothetical protein G6F25_010093 [Rhizopus arrhizus]
MSSEDTNSITLPWNWKPGSDSMSKLLFNDPTVVNLVVQSLLGSTDIPANSYTVASNEWADGTRSDVVYAAESKSTKTQPPILIEFQNQVNHEFMNRVINYSLSAYRRYKVYPIVPIFAIKGFSSIEVEKEFVVADKKPFLEIESKFWAKKCFLVSSNSVLEYIGQSPMDPMIAMGYFLTSNAVSLTSLRYQFDPTVRLLFQICKDLTMKESDPKNMSVESMEPLLEDIKRRIEDVVDEDDNIPGEAVKKIKGYISESFELISEQSKLLIERTKAAESSRSNVNEDRYTEDDIILIESKSKAGKNRNWKHIYDEGKAQGLFKSYSSSHSLKTSYYHLLSNSSAHSFEATV